MLKERNPLSSTTTLPVEPRGAWRQLLRDLEVRPSKRMGQNFLTDQAIADRIVAAAAVGPGTTVVEVGPGLGILTRSLIDAVGATGEVVAVELDRRLAAYLRGTLASNPVLRVIEGDILRQPLAELACDERAYTVVANLPYNITSAALRYFLDSPFRPTTLVVMVQDEVARRIAARPPHMSILAVAIQLYGDPEIVFQVDRRAFTPSPHVDSAVLRIAVRSEPLLPVARIASFFVLVNAGFAQRRKQLLNSLAARMTLPKEALAAALDAAGIAPTSRAQTLTVADWIRLSDVLHHKERV